MAYDVNDPTDHCRLVTTIRGRLAPFQAILGATQIVMSVLYFAF